MTSFFEKKKKKMICVHGYPLSLLTDNAQNVRQYRNE